MKKGTILKNNWAGYPCYFINMNYPVRTGKAEASKTGGYTLCYLNDKWNFRKSEYYNQSLRDKEMYPEIGHIDLEKVCIDALLKVLNLQSTEGEKYDNS